MSTEQIFDIDALLEPISDDSPCGVDLREESGFDSPFQQLKDAREEAMNIERNDRSAIDVGRWSVVVDTAVGIIRESSKDIEVCAMLLEGLSRTHGLAGIECGFQLTERLVNQYWEELFPRLDPDDEESLEDRIAVFAGLNGTGQPGTLARYFALMPITEGGDEDFLSYQLDQAQQINRNPDPDQRAENAASLGYSVEIVEASAARTPATFYVRMKNGIEGCTEALSEMDKAFTEVCGYQGPPTSLISEGLEKLKDNIMFLGRDKIEMHEASENAEAESEASSVESDAGTSSAPAKPGQATGAIISREDAISRLRVVAKYFRETEPHSPIPYSLENLIRWAQLPLAQLIEEWIPDETARERFTLMTGVGGNNASDDYSE